MAEKLKIIPLGGLDEIGKNITVLEYGKDMIRDLDAVAAKTGRTRNEIIAMSLEFALENMEILQIER